MPIFDGDIFDGDIFNGDIFDTGDTAGSAHVVEHVHPAGVLSAPLPADIEPDPHIVEQVHPIGLLTTAHYLEPDPHVVEHVHPAGRLEGVVYELEPHIVEQVHPAGSLGILQELELEVHVVEQVHPVGHLTTGDGRIQRLYRGAQRQPGVFIREPWFPRQRIAELSTYHALDRSFQLMEWGTAVVQINKFDRVAGAIQEGYLLEIDDVEQPPWIGYILRPRDSLRNGTLEIPALGYEAILDGHTAPQDEVYRDPISVGAVVRSLISRMNARDDTGIRVGRIENGPSLLDLEVGGQSVFSALGELHERSNMEWALRWEISAGHAEAFLDWRREIGEDFSSLIHLWGDRHFADLDYASDVSKAVQATTATGGLGRRLTVRPSITRMGPTSAQRRDIGAFDRFAISNPGARRLADLPPALRTERIIHVMMTENLTELSRAAGMAAERPLAAIETFTADVNTLADWRYLSVGNYVTITADLGRGTITRRARIRDAMPSNDVGLIQLNLEVPV